MKRSTTELYGAVPRDIIETRNSLAKFFIGASKKRIEELQSIPYIQTDDALIEDCLKAQEHWEKLLREEIWMREIKFRAFNKKYKTMYKSSSIYKIFFDNGSDDVETDDLVTHNKEEIILMQYTGLKDKNGVEIYEGDIIKGTKENEYKGQSNVFFGYNWNLQPFSYLGVWDMNKFEVIGNIYENKELLDEH